MSVRTKLLGYMMLSEDEEELILESELEDEQDEESEEEEKKEKSFIGKKLEQIEKKLDEKLEQIQKKIEQKVDKFFEKTKNFWSILGESIEKFDEVLQRVSIVPFLVLSGMGMISIYALIIILSLFNL